MTEMLSQALPDALNYLIALQHDHAQPAEARVRLRQLQEQHTARMDLLWEHEAFDGALHYDLLLGDSDVGRVSLSYCPDRKLPWALRGAHRWSEGDLLRVNSTTLPVAQAVACLDFIWEEAPLADRLVNACLIQEALDQQPVNLTTADLQEAMDAFRRARRLYTAEETHRWMSHRGLSHAQLEQLVSEQAAIAALRDRITADEVEPYFAMHRADFDRARIVRCLCKTADSASTVYEAISAGRLDFFTIAQTRFLAQVGSISTTDLFTTITRGSSPTPLTSTVFDTVAGDLVGPVPDDGQFAVARVLSIEPAVLDEATRKAIKQQLFTTWLDERREAAEIEWNWGNVARTAHVS